MTTPDLVELERLARAATPGEWFTVGQPWLPAACETYVVAGSPDPHAAEMVCDMPTADVAGVEDRYEEDEWTARNWANAAYIAAANPQAILSLITTNRDLVAALLKLIQHTLDCEKEIDKLHGLGDDAGAGCSINICDARRVLQAALSPTQPKSGEVG